jgi:hypothetical protein
MCNRVQLRAMEARQRVALAGGWIENSCPPAGVD